MGVQNTDLLISRWSALLAENASLLSARLFLKPVQYFQHFDGVSRSTYHEKVYMMVWVDSPHVQWICAADSRVCHL